MKRLTAWIVLWVLMAGNPAFGHEIQLVDGADVSPDGSQVAFSWRGDLWIAPIAGGAARQLTTHDALDAQPRFAPDGERLAFVSTRDGATQLHVVDVQGGEPLQLTFHTEGCALQEWFPGGDELLVSASRDHFWRHAERFFRVGTEPRSGERLLFDAHGENGTVSPDGEKLLFTREGTRWWRKGYRGSQASQIWLYDMNEGSFQQVAAHETGCRSPLWHPNGKAFYYVSGASGSFNLWFQRIGKGKPRQLTDFKDDSVYEPRISRDGSTIVFRHLLDLYRLSTGKNARPAKISLQYVGDNQPEATINTTTNSATDVSFSRDGLEIAFIAGGDVWVMDTVLREPKQVTTTAAEERDVLFSPDGSSLVFVSDHEGQSDIWQATRDDADKYWWQNDSFSLKRLTEDDALERSLSYSPTGDHLAFVRARGDLWLMKSDGSEPRQLFASWNVPDYDWSPDGKWLTYALSDANFNRDIHVIPVDGSRPAFNISRHPDNESNPAWSPDGKVIAFAGRRQDTEVDIYFVYLQAEEDEEDARDRKLESALEKMKKARKSSSGAAAAAGKADKPDDKKADAKASEESGKDAAESQDKVAVRIDFAGIHDRIRRVAIANSSEGNLLWSPDSKKLAFSATINGKSGTYTISPPDELSPKLLTSETGQSAHWLKTGNQIAWLSSGTPATLSASGASTKYSFNVRQTVDVTERYATAFMQCWRVMRDNYYDERMNNRNWDAIYRKYAPAARAAVDDSSFSQIVSLMLGELNGSHLGFFAMRGGGRAASSSTWRESTAHLGVRFDPGHQGPGLKIRDVIHGSPATEQRSRLEAGELILSIDGKSVDPAIDLSAVLNGPLDRDISLRLQNAKGEERTVQLRPISYGAARSLLYEHWVRANRKLVDDASSGTLAYLHIRGMNMSSFYRFERELFEVAAGKDGIVIDVRENGGGSTTDHLLTILTQPVHAITVPRGGTRGYPHDRKVYASWHKPIIVLCNQNSFSNAEIFSHAIKTLKRGKVVGVTTAGGVISTGGARIMDFGFIRMPFRGWFLLETGQDMELNGAAPDVEIWPQPGEWPAGIDRQLAKAVELLGEDVRAWKERPLPPLRKASGHVAEEPGP